MPFRTLALLLSLCLTTQWVNAEPADHPLLSPYPGAEIDEWLFIEYEKTELPSGPVGENGHLPTDTLVGDTTRITYEVDGVSTFKVFENYKRALTEAGAEIVSVCELTQCGEERSTISELAKGVTGGSSVNNHFRKPYFIRTKMEGARGPVHIGIFVGGYEGEVQLQQTVIEEAPIENELIAVNKEYLAKAIQSAASTDQRTPEQKQQDHPMIARYPGARLERNRSTEYEKISIPAGGPAGSETADQDMLELTGDVYQHSYQADNVSTLKAYQNYVQAVTKLGLSIEYSCELDGCGSSARELGNQVAIRNVNNFHRNPYYLVASRNTGQGRVVMALFFGGYQGDVLIQQTIVEEKGAATDLVKVDADQLYQEIQQSGKALVYGIYFDTDSAEVKPESSEALQAISGLLESHPDLNLYVVGHTDDTGEGDYNLSLSSRRASSVVEALKTDYDIDDDRLKPAGVGPYAPVAGNESDDGRRLNRRVELVRRL